MKPITNDEVMQNAENVVEVPSKEEVQMSEAEVLASLLGAAQEIKDEYIWIVVSRPDKDGNLVEKLRFRVKGLTAKELRRLTDTYTKKQKNKMGMFVPVEFNEDAWRSHLIYLATHPDDRKIMWDNPTLRMRLGVNLAIDTIDAALKPGEKDEIADKISEASGYTNSEAVKTVKN